MKSLVLLYLVIQKFDKGRGFPEGAAGLVVSEGLKDGVKKIWLTKNYVK